MICSFRLPTGPDGGGTQGGAIVKAGVVTVPSGDTTLTVTYDRDSGSGSAEVAVPGIVTPTVHIIERKGG